eukprot:TRINITY_DN39019_c0_g1_i1.p1 TRINITY_DN39019_c0_g1~~TRINITY_DN39019_c0_g1_i1.p1  ORF type:complete len:488 (+),score=63.59 TRINITY_DN39019_c0_g1_i1:290-1753(+)
MECSKGVRIGVLSCGLALLLCFSMPGLSTAEEPPLSLTGLHEALGALLSPIASGPDSQLGRVHLDDAKFGKTLLYSLALEVEGGRQVDFSLVEEITTWDYLLPPAHSGMLPPAAASNLMAAESLGEDEVEEGEDDVAGSRPFEAPSAVLPPFRLEGPLELWVEQAGQLRFTMPDEVEMGKVKKVVLADGAVITVDAAKAFTLARPLRNLPLPLTSRKSSSASSSFVSPMDTTPGGGVLMEVVDELRSFAQGEDGGGLPGVAFLVVEPSALRPAPAALHAAASGSRHSPSVQVRHLGAGAVEVHPYPHSKSASSKKKTDKKKSRNSERADALELVLGDTDSLLWQFSHSNHSASARLVLKGVEQSLKAALKEGDGITSSQKRRKQKRRFSLLRASATPLNLIRVEFEVDSSVPTHLQPEHVNPLHRDHLFKEGEKPLFQRQRFEALLQLRPPGGKIAELVQIKRVGQVGPSVSYSFGEMTGNTTMVQY